MEKIIIPLDGFEKLSDILKLIYEIKFAEEKQEEKLIWGFKINTALIQYGNNIIRIIKDAGFKVFADPKLHDISNTIHNSIKYLLSCSVDIISVHCSSVYVAKSIKSKTFWISAKDISEKIAGITILTSLEKDNIRFAYNDKIDYLIYKFSEFAKKANYGYIVCPSKYIHKLVKDNDIKIITPGIRPLWYSTKDDQINIDTPSEAIKNGADLLVIGRPILESNDKINTIRKINNDIYTTWANIKYC